MTDNDDLFKAEIIIPVIKQQMETITYKKPGHDPSSHFQETVSTVKSHSEAETISRKSFESIINRNTLAAGQQPLVSIIVCVYNGEKTIKQCLESIMTQTYLNWELLIVDDGSVDDTALIINDFIRPEKVKYIYQENRGLNAARNSGIKAAAGQYLKFFDADDILFAYSLEVLVSHLHRQPEDVAMVYADYLAYYQENNTYKYRPMPATPVNKASLYRQQLTSNIFLIGTTLLKKEVVVSGGLFNGLYRAATDFEFFNRLILNYRVTKVEIPTHIYLIHKGQITGNLEKLRIFTDMSCLELISQIGVETGLFPDLHGKPALLADALENQSRSMLNRGDTPVDTIIKLLKSAQQHNFTERRQSLLGEVYKINNRKVILHFRRFLKQPELIEAKDIMADSQAIYHKYRLAYKKYLYYKMYLKQRNESGFNYSSEFFRTPAFNINYKNSRNGRENYYIFSFLWDYFSLPEHMINHCNRVDEIWVVNSFLKSSLVKTGIDANKIFIIPAGIDTELYRPEVKRIDLPTDKRFRFLFIGDFTESKGIYNLIEAYLEEFSAHEDVSLLIKYEEPYYQENKKRLKKFINELTASKPGPEIVFIERVLSETELAGLYTSCQCFASPYRADSFNLRAQEAVACGIPVITTGIGDFNLPFSEESLFLAGAEFNRDDTIELEEFRIKESIYTFNPAKNHLKEQLRLVFANRDKTGTKVKAAREILEQHLTTDITLKKITGRVTEINSFQS